MSNTDTPPTHTTKAAIAALAHFAKHDALWTILTAEEVPDGPVIVKGLTHLSGNVAPSQFGFGVGKV